jgi:DNA-binding PadR family transcriptional regulator
VGRGTTEADDSELGEQPGDLSYLSTARRRVTRFGDARFAHRATISGSDIGYRLYAVKEFLRGAVRLHILHHAADRDVHGAWMSEELAEHGHRISPGTLYPTLHRMEDEGLLRSREIVVNGRRRRVYRATRRGQRTLEQMRDALRELADEVLGHGSSGGTSRGRT